MKRLDQYDTFEVPTDLIVVDPDFNCRGAFTPQSVKELADSIAAHGLQFPVVVRPQGDHYQLIAGHRRFMAMTVFLKWVVVPACVRDLNDRAASVLNFTENLERANLNILEEAKAIQRLYPNGVSLRTAANELNRPTRWVATRLQLLALPDRVQELAAAGLLSAVALECIARAGTPEKQIATAESISAAKTEASGKTRFIADRRTFKSKRSKKQLSDMIANMLNQGIAGLAPRALCWAAGYITDDELNEDIRKILAEEPLTHQIQPMHVPRSRRGNMKLR